MLHRLMGPAGAGRGALIALGTVGSALVPSVAVSTDAPPVRSERWDQASARAHAESLLPIIADDVINGERHVYRSIPAGGDLGLYYQFRLRPQPIRYRPLCEMRTVSLRYDFARQLPAGSSSVGDFDLMAMKRAGGFRYGALSTHARYHRLTPAPQSDQEHASRCAAADIDQGWLDASSPHEFESEAGYLSLLRAALVGNRPAPRFWCLRDGTSGCPISGDMILDIAEQQRRAFSAIRLSDGTEWAQFTYFDVPTAAPGSEVRNIIVEMRLGEIVAITLVYSTMAHTAV